MTDKESQMKRQLPRARQIAASVVTAALVLVLTACAATVPSTPISITGEVSNALPGDGRPAQFLVEGGTQPAGSVSDKAQVTITPQTQFFSADGQPASLDAIAKIKAGTQVNVWFAGAVAESYPVQGSAQAVQILKQ
jgi:hypothetical protein